MKFENGKWVDEVGIDVMGNYIYEGDILVWSRGEIAYIYKIVNGEVKVIGDWQIGSIGLDDYYKERDYSEYPESMIKALKERRERVLNRKIDELIKAPKKLTKVVNMLNESNPHMPLEGSIENPKLYDVNGRRVAI